MKNMAPQTAVGQDRLAEVGLGDSSAITMTSRIMAKKIAGNFGLALMLGEQPGADDDEGRLHEFRRLDRDEGNGDPAARALDFHADEQHQHHHRQSDDAA
jgi:hypothetical protein